VEGKTHGSPWHEFIESDGFRDALRSIPGFRDQFNRMRKKTGEQISGDEIADLPAEKTQK
jgi:GrpB-like predicted nucleotidyltransferase (UPF0157 family)